jgi:hypothetical protein
MLVFIVEKYTDRIIQFNYRTRARFPGTGSMFITL